MIYVHLALAILIAVLGAYTDIRYGQVKNKHLLIALSVWLVLMTSESIVTRSSAILTAGFGINIGLAFVVSLILYLTDIWAPGDCKLYIVISIIFPLQAYVVRKGNIFPALDIVIYAFAIGYIVLIGIIIYRQARGKKVNIKQGIELRRILIHSLSVLPNMGLISAINTVLGTYVSDFYYANQMLCVLAVIGLICLLQQKANTVRRILGFIGLGFFLVLTALYGTWISALLSIVESLVIAVIIEIINNRARANTYREITGDEVRPGMILSYSTLLAMQKCIDPDLPQTTTESRRSRMNRHQAEAVKNWCKNAKSGVMIVEMIPFAPFIAFAVLVKTVFFFILGS